MWNCCSAAAAVHCSLLTTVLASELLVARAAHHYCSKLKQQKAETAKSSKIKDQSSTSNVPTYYCTVLVPSYIMPCDLQTDLTRAPPRAGRGWEKKTSGWLGGRSTSNE